jgi:hypothetical protein
MEPRLDAEVESINDALALKANLTDPRLTDQRTPLDDSVTSAKIVNGTIVNADVNTSAAIAYTKVTRPPLSNASDVAIDAGTLAGGQVIKYNAGTSNWVNGAAAGGVTASATAPTLATAAAGDAWFDTNDGTLYVCYVDVDSTKQWVQVQANSALEGSILARLGALESQSIAYGTMSPNYVINGGFDIWQRGTSFTNPSAFVGFTADRWLQGFDGSGATRTWTQQAHTPGAAPIAGSTEAAFFLRCAQTVAGSGASYNMLFYKVEDVRTLAGQTLSFSFYAKAGSSLTLPSIDFEQSFGSGGSANVYTGLTSSISVGTSWNRYTYTVTLPSISGKTVGANSYLGIRIFMPINATFTFDIWGVQLERGSVATSFRRNAPSIQAELAACQRYYFRFTGGNETSIGWGTATGTTAVTFGVQFPVTMRTAPTAIDSFGSLFPTNDFDGLGSFSGFTLTVAGAQSATVRGTGSSGLTLRGAYRLGVTATGFLSFSAEL